MKRFAVVFLFVVCFSAAVFPQSGRKITPAPTPEPNVEEPAYSESAPYKPRRVYPPNWNEDKNSREKKDTKPKLQQTNAPKTNETVSADDEDVIKIEANLVTIPVSVFDRNGIYIPGLTQENFKIFEDGKEQEIIYFGTSDKPFTVVLLLDTSPSTEYKIEEIRSSAKAFVRQLKEQDSVLVIEFDENIHVLTEATRDRQKINKAIDEADMGYGTSLYDTVDFSLRKRLNKIEGRKAIVLFTDGVDTTSDKAGYDENIRDAEEAGALIFPIQYNTFFDNGRNGGVLSSPFPFPGSGGGIFRPRGTRAEDYALGREYLNDLAAATGGRVFRPEATPGGLTAAFEGIAEELRRQYNIGYYPQEEGKTGERKQIKVRVNRQNLIVRARDSYIVGMNKQTQN
jgi:Ca-activated chloride channel homolog